MVKPGESTINLESPTFLGCPVHEQVAVKMEHSLCTLISPYRAIRQTRDNSSEVTLRYGMNSITFEFPARFVRRYLKRDLVWGNESLEVASDNDRDAT